MSNIVGVIVEEAVVFTYSCSSFDIEHKTTHCKYLKRDIFQQYGFGTMAATLLLSNKVRREPCIYLVSDLGSLTARRPILPLLTG